MGPRGRRVVERHVDGRRRRAPTGSSRHGGAGHGCDGGTGRAGGTAAGPAHRDRGASRDVGARAIRVEIEDGGKSLIRVSDDGEGMGRADAELALSRHATSKIREAADLIGVGTFGFRGEALPAIASVSRFELETSPDGVTGTRLRLVGGKREAVDDVVRQRGTTVTVRALFFNTPARRKFLRAQATETRAVAEAVTLLALTRPDTAFTLSSDERTLIDVRPAADAIERVAALWGGALADTLLAIAHREGPLEVRGFAQRPAQAKPTGRKGYVFVRGRPIRDPFILRAAEAGYRSTLAPDDRPSLILFLDLPGDAVDVNVHPSKLEVRFRDKFFVEKVVEEAVRDALGPLTAAAPLGAGMKLEQMDLVEVNEAFAPQYLAVEKELGLDRAKTNVHGGAIAIGHPLAATGTRVTIHLLHALRRAKQRFGLGSACIGGGPGAAVIVEAFPA